MNVFQQLYKSIYSPKDIAKFRFQGIGKTIRYVFLLALISIIPVALQFTLFATTSMQEVKDSLVNELPPFTIENGNLNSETSKPITIERDHLIIILDDTGKMNESDLNKNENTVALLHDSFVFINDGNVQSSSYDLFDDLVITNETLIEFIDSMSSLKWILIPVSLFILYIFTSGMTFLKVTIFAIIGVAIGNLLKRKVNYRQSWRMTAYSATVSTLFFTLMKLLQTFIAAAPLLDWLVITIVLYLAIKEIPQRKTSSN
ncbi:DUF1189 domain-containing protein [Rossellomorea aquimaris]|uniref:DUF1189 domain-containing protein n=1 Tax=Rossellomorea aquimaris TaxID=189382 RepID=UPI0007D0496E|nr:DUF1189 domain-containing protein [Rossellomorea aquimaris]